MTDSEKLSHLILVLSRINVSIDHLSLTQANGEYHPESQTLKAIKIALNESKEIYEQYKKMLVK